MESPPRERLPARARRMAPRAAALVTALSLAAAVLVTGGALALADHHAVDEFGGAAAVFVPADGHVEWVRDSRDNLRMAESARSIGFEHILQLPSVAASAVIDALGDDTGTAQLWRELDTPLALAESDELRQTSSLHALSSEGVSLLASHGGSLGFVYSPPLIELPATVAPGASWSSEGAALPQGMLSYSARYTAVVPTTPELLTASTLSKAELAACLETRGGSTYRDASGAVILDIEETDLWCPGRGRVAIVATVNGEPFSQGPAASPRPPAAGGPSQQPAWTSMPTWSARELPLLHRDSFFGEQSATLSLAVSPQRTPSGLIVAANQNGDDVQAFRAEGASLVRQWSAHPGGQILSLAVAGEVTIVATSAREIVAYSATGIRLWQSSTTELVLAPIVTQGDEALIVGLDGRVVSIEAHSGEVAWEHALGADVSLPVALGPDRVIVIDRAGAVTALDRASGETVWSHAGSASPAAAAATIEDVVVVASEDGLVRAYALDDGSRRWSTRYTGRARSLQAMPAMVVLVSDEATLALDPRSGAAAWKGAGAEGVVTDGRQQLLLDDARARLLDSTGATTGEWEVPSLGLSIYRYALASDDGFWIFRSNEPAILVGAR